MNAINLLLLSVALYGIGGILSLLLGGSKKVARFTSGWSGLIAAGLGVFAALKALVSLNPDIVNLFSIPPFGWLGLHMDALSAFLVGLIALVGAGASIYSLSSKEVTGFIGFLTNLFLATMLLVVTVNNAFFFMIFWEMMTLVTYLLVIWESDNEETMRTGYIYMLVAHIGAALILVAFLTLYYKTSSFDFGFWRLAWLSSGIKGLVFLLAFIGFGAKAGMVPLHFWAPGAYAAAPDHISALMASVMKKTAIYGFLRICIDIIGPIGWGWGFMVLDSTGSSDGQIYRLENEQATKYLTRWDKSSLCIGGASFHGLARHSERSRRFYSALEYLDSRSCHRAHLPHSRSAARRRLYGAR